MGHSPSLQDTINKSEDAKKAVQQAVANAVTALKNDKVAAETYINSNSKGIVKVVSEIFASYSKFSDEYNLKGVDASVDAITKTATDYNIFIVLIFSHWNCKIIIAFCGMPLLKPYCSSVGH